MHVRATCTGALVGTRLGPKRRRKTRRQKFGHLAGHGGAARRLLHFRAPPVPSEDKALNPQHVPLS